MIGLAGIQARLGNIDQAISNYEHALTLTPGSSERWRVEFILAQFYSQQGDLAKALQYAESALDSAPEAQKQAIQDFITQLPAQP
jgi:tetratricopeptide (TPR) repeat protein